MGAPKNYTAWLSAIRAGHSDLSYRAERRRAMLAWWKVPANRKRMLQVKRDLRYRAKLSESSKANWMDVVLRARMTKRIIATMQTPRMRQLASANIRRWANSEAGKQLKSELGRHQWTDEYRKLKLPSSRQGGLNVWKRPGFRAAQRKQKREMWRDGRFANAGPRTTRRYGVVFRSGWEADWATLLNRSGLDWAYEPHRIPLNDGRSFAPDFFIPEFACFIEVHPSPDGRVAAVARQGYRIFLVGQPSEESCKRLVRRIVRP